MELAWSSFSLYGLTSDGRKMPEGTEDLIVFVTYENVIEANSGEA